MTTHNSRTSSRTMADLAFSAFLFSLAGWCLLESALFTAGAGVHAHLVACVPGLALSAIAFRRCRVWWPSFANVGLTVERSAAIRWSFGDVRAWIALITGGGVLALSAKGGTLALMICAGAFSLAPWSRMSFCGRHFFICCALVATGAIPILHITLASQHLVFYLTSAWALWAVAAAVLVLTVKAGQQGARQGSIGGIAVQTSERKAANNLDKSVERP